MIIKKISIKNFRGIKELNNFELNNYNVLVGKNDSGKSIILYALKSFFDVKIDQKDIYKGSEGENVEIEVSFSVNKDINELMLDSDKYLTIKKIFNNECKLIGTKYKSYDYIDTKVNDLWNKNDKDLEDIIKNQGEKITGKKTSEKIDQIMDLIRMPREDIYHDYGELEKHMKKYFEVALPAYNFFQSEENIDPNATNFQNKFKDLSKPFFSSKITELEELKTGIEKQYQQEFDQILEFMKKNVPELNSISSKIDTDWQKSISKFDLLLSTSNDKYDISISHKGTGFRRLLMVAYFEYFASKRDIEDCIFAIEEPEIYLHPSAQETLLESLLEITNKTQVLVTTHSPIFAGADNIESIVLVKKNKDGLSIYNRQGDTKEIIDELGIKPSYNLLKNANFLIFVEGRSDICFLKQYAKIVLGKNFDADNIVCLIGGGGSLVNYAELDLFKLLRPDKRYAVMVDSDNNESKKERSTKKIEDRCKLDGALYFKLSKREIENYCHEDAITRVFQLPKQCHVITDNEDVAKEIDKYGTNKKIKNRFNERVFESMTKEEWENKDNKNEISGFILEIYKRMINN